MTSTAANGVNSQVHGVLECRAPVVLLVDALLVCLGKRRIVVESSDSQAELGHGMEGGRASVKNLLHKLGEGGASSPLLGEGVDLLLGGDLTGHQKPEETFREGFGAAGGFGQEFLALGNGFAAETDTFVCEAGGG